MIINENNRPRFIISKSKIYENLSYLNDVFDYVSYSWKTNPTIGEVLNTNESCYMSIHSINELKTVNKKSKVWYFSMAWDYEELDILFTKYNISNFVIDNEKDLEILLDYIQKNNKTINLLLRTKQRENTIQTGKHYVFGMKSEIVKKHLKDIRSNKNVNRLGIHFHRKTQNVSEWNLIQEVKNSIGEEVLSFIDLINIGGGLPAKYKNIDDKSIESIINKLKEFVDYCHKNNTKVIVEPGRFIASSAVKLECYITQIIDNTIFVNVSIFNGSLDTVVANIKLIVDNELKESNKRYTIKGCTPDSADILRYSVYLDEPRVGDKLVFINAGAYNYRTNFCNLDKIEEIIED